MDALKLILSFGIGILIFIFVIFIVTYVIGSIAIMKALKAMRYDKPWMA